MRSLPARGAWIEIDKAAALFDTIERSLPARGAWIEIDSEQAMTYTEPSRSPHGERGLKYIGISRNAAFIVSLPARGAWIEMGR